MAVSAGTQYATLNRAQLSYEYLHTNSTTHEFLFGAIVELVDNSRDASARMMKIYSEENEKFRGGASLCFLDDGIGMDRVEASNVMTFGYSGKRLDPSMVGQYGNGLKSGAMRVGKDFILFTKKSDVLTIVFLSRTFHEKERIDEVLVPMPAFTTDKEPLAGTPMEIQKHDLEMELICLYSPFKSVEDLMAQFDKIEGDHGTLVVCYNLRLLDNGEPELDFISDPEDIRVADPDGRDKSLHPERASLRAYLAIVYADPRMKIYIQGTKVCTRRVISGLYTPRQYKFTSYRFKARAEKEAEKAQHAAKIASEKLSESESKLREFENRHGRDATDRMLRAEWRQLQDAVTVAKQNTKYSADRAKEKGRKCAGVVGVVDVPYVVLEPTHNKQDFADAREYRALLKALGDYMEQYWKDMNLASKSGGVLQFWRHYGYESNDWQAPPSNDKVFVQRRMMSVEMSLQCDACLKWRVVAYNSSYVGKSYPETWVCKDNPDTTLNNCSIPEKKLVVPEGKKLDKGLTDEEAERKREKLEKTIEKQQKELKRLGPTVKDTPPSTSSSGRQAAHKANQRMSGKKSPSPPPSIAQRSSRVRQPAPEKPKTKAELRNQLEKERKEKEQKEREKQRKLEEERRKKLEDERRKKAAEAKKKAEDAAKRGRRRVVAEEEEEEEDSDSEEEQEVVVEKKRAGSRNAGIIPQKAVKTAAQSQRSAAINQNAAASRRSSGAQVQANATTSRRREASPPAKEVADGSTPAKKGKIERMEAHSSSATGEEVTDARKVEILSAQLRRALSFFLPPDWTMNKQQVNKLTAIEMIAMDLGDFFSSYERGLKSLVQSHQRSAEEYKSKLARVRRLAATLLRTISEDFDVDPSCDTEQVDLLLEECLRQMSSGGIRNSR